MAGVILAFSYYSVEVWTQNSFRFVFEVRKIVEERCVTSLNAAAKETTQNTVFKLLRKRVDPVKT